MPNLVDLAKTLKRMEIFTNRKVDEVFAGNYKSTFKGRGLEVDNLRQYAEGDDARYIDWVATAKSGKTFIKEYKETRELTTMVLVDLSATMNFGTTAKSKKQIALELAATILFSALKNNDKFGALLFLGDKVSFIPPQKGRTHLLRILKDIIVGFENNYNKTSDLNKALQLLMSTVKRSAVCFLISDEIDPENAKLFNVVSKKYDFVFLKVNDPLENGEVPDGLFTVADIFNKQTEIIDLTDKKVVADFQNLRREKNVAQEKFLREKRIDYLFLTTLSDIYKELGGFFKKRQVRN